MKLNQSFFEKDTLIVAKELIGKILTYKSEKGTIKGIINETEAYTEEDEACHTFGGKKTKRNQTMFCKGGHLYIYFTYGMYHCSNIVTEKEGRGCAVLIRSVIPIAGIEIMKKNRNHKKENPKDLSNGPAKVCMAYGWDKNHNGIDTTKKDSQIYIEDLEYIPENITQTQRIGISKAKELDWRFKCDKFNKK